MNTGTPLGTLRVLWAALLGSNVVYVAVSEVLRAQRPLDAPPVDLTMVGALAVAALITAVVSVFLPGRLLRAAARVAPLATRTRLDPDPDPFAAAQGFRRPPPTATAWDDPSAARDAALRAYRAPFIVGMALAESISIHGLVLAVLGAPRLAVAPFFALGVALQLARFPTEERVTEAFAEARGLTA